ncbi:MAG: hypothetical protein ACE361_19205 [Aureliella sp.]
MEPENQIEDAVKDEGTAPSPPQVDPAKINEIRTQLYREQNFVLAVIAGIVAGIAEQLYGLQSRSRQVSKSVGWPWASDSWSDLQFALRAKV